MVVRNSALEELVCVRQSKRVEIITNSLFKRRFRSRQRRRILSVKNTVEERVEAIEQEH